MDVQKNINEQVNTNQENTQNTKNQTEDNPKIKNENLLSDQNTQNTKNSSLFQELSSIQNKILQLNDDLSNIYKNNQEITPNNAEDFLKPPTTNNYQEHPQIKTDETSQSVQAFIQNINTTGLTPQSVQKINETKNKANISDITKKYLIQETYLNDFFNSENIEKYISEKNKPQIQNFLNKKYQGHKEIQNIWNISLDVKDAILQHYKKEALTQTSPKITNPFKNTSQNPLNLEPATINQKITPFFNSQKQGSSSSNSSAKMFEGRGSSISIKS